MPSNFSRIDLEREIDMVLRVAFWFHVAVAVLCLIMWFLHPLLVAPE